MKLSSTRLIHPELPNNGGYSTWFAELRGYDHDPENLIALGSASIVLFRDARWNPGFYDRMDEVDADMELIAAAVRDPSGAAADELFDEFGGDLIVIDRVSIEPEYRGKGLSHLLVDAAAEALSPDGVIALLPMPPGDERPENVAKLQRHWTDAGFIEHRLGVFVRAAVRAEGKS
ncbi:hypothetical protein B7495_06100 [Cryobacterium sp. LW097]|nr:hypothetical protein B7495_06100 [Cryobacterium sp. LW097]